MKVKIVVGPDGTFALFSREGTLAGGAKVFSGIIGKLQASGVKMTEIGEPEQHSHDDPAKVKASLHTHS